MSRERRGARAVSVGCVMPRSCVCACVCVCGRVGPCSHSMPHASLIVVIREPSAWSSSCLAMAATRAGSPPGDDCLPGGDAFAAGGDAFSDCGAPGSPTNGVPGRPPCVGGPGGPPRVGPICCGGPGGPPGRGGPMCGGCPGGPPGPGNPPGRGPISGGGRPTIGMPGCGDIAWPGGGGRPGALSGAPNGFPM